MLDIKLIRTNPDLVKAGMKKRNKDMDAQIDEIIAIDAKRRGLSAGQARSILAFGTEERMNAVAEETVKKGLTVRELERLAKKADKPESASKQKQLFSRDSYYSEMELALNHELHRKVKIKETGSGAGTIEIAFYSREELSELADLLAGKQK